MGIACSVCIFVHEHFSPNLNTNQHHAPRPRPRRFTIGKVAALGGGLVCVLALLVQRETIFERATSWPAYVIKRVQDSYFYYGTCMLLSFSSTACFFHWDEFVDFLTMNTFESLCVANVIIYTSSFIVHRLTFSEDFGAKDVAMMFYATVVGAAMAPILYLGSAVIVEAVWTTAALVAELCMAAAFISTEITFHVFIGPIILLYTIVDVATIAGFFTSTAAPLGRRAYEVNLYGGTVLFAGFVMVCSHLIYVVSEVLKQDDVYSYDPINAGILLFFGTTNLFVRVAVLIANEDRN